MSPLLPSRLWSSLAMGTAVLLVSITLATMYGTESVSMARAFSDPDSLDRMIVLEARFPRVLLGAVAGGGLAAVGVAFQAILRNPLAEPYVLGVSGGAALGATIAILFGLSGATLLGAATVPFAALLGGLASTAVVYSLARATGSFNGTSILLAGVVVNAIASAGITFLKTLVSATKAQELLFWLMGFLDVPSTGALIFVAIYVAVGGGILLYDAGRLNLLALGHEPAENLGIDVRSLERRTFFACSMVVGAIVSITGLIGFIGLIVPHALRRIFGPDVRIGLPASFMVGGATLVLCDMVSRTLFRFLHTEPPVGAVTALIGGPLFLLLLRRRAPLA